jgi:uncharacterized metal-binding protein
MLNGLCRRGDLRRKRTLSAVFACSTASQGAGRSKKTRVTIDCVRLGEMIDDGVPESAVSITVKPFLQTFLCVRVTMSDMP